MRFWWFDRRYILTEH